MAHRSPWPISALSRFCAGQERPLSIIDASYIAGYEQSPTDPAHAHPTMSTFVDKSLDKASTDDEVAQAVAGTSLYGWPGSAAHTLSTALSPVHNAVVLTTSRVFVVADPGTDIEPAWQCRLDQLAQVERAPRFLQAGRIKMAFVDGTWLMIATGIMSAEAAKDFTKAFGSVSTNTEHTAPSSVPKPSTPLARYQHKLSSLVEPGETPLALERIRYRRGKQIDVSPPELTWGRLLDTVSMNLPPRLEVALAEGTRGTTVVGWPGCQAWTIRDATLDNGVYLFVTDRRCVVVQDLHGRPSITWAAPHTGVLEVSLAPSRLPIRRIHITFADRSWLKLRTTGFDDGATQRLLDAWKAAGH